MSGMYNTYMKDNTDNGAPEEGVSVQRARGELADLINRAAYGRERILLKRRGKPVAAIVSIKDIEMLEALEDRLDVAAARRALRESRGQKPALWKDVKARLGL
jgi:prevent-host-death family protein